MLMPAYLAVRMLAVALYSFPQGGEPARPEPTVLKAGLGACSADVHVRDEEGRPVYNATVHVRVRYGMFGVKRSDLEVGTKK